MGGLDFCRAGHQATVTERMSERRTGQRIALLHRYASGQVPDMGRLATIHMAVGDWLGRRPRPQHAQAYCTGTQLANYGVYAVASQHSPKQCTAAVQMSTQPFGQLLCRVCSKQASMPTHQGPVFRPAVGAQLVACAGAIKAAGATAQGRSAFTLDSEVLYAVAWLVHALAVVHGNIPWHTAAVSGSAACILHPTVHSSTLGLLATAASTGAGCAAQHGVSA